MEEFSTFTEKFPYVFEWMIVFVIYVVSAVSGLYWFAAKHPEIFRDDTNIRQSAEQHRHTEKLRRLFDNAAVVIYSVLFLWMFGLVFIASGFNPKEDLIVLEALFLFAALVSLLGLQKSKTAQKPANQRRKKPKPATKHEIVTSLKEVPRRRNKPRGIFFV